MSVRYQLQSRRERGVLADLFLAVRTDDGLPVEVKLFHPETTDPDYARELAAATHALGRVNSPGHLTVLDLGVAEGRLAVVRERADGPSFGALIEHLVAQGRPLLEEVALTLLIQLAEDVEAAHEAGVVHGGLTPGNLHVSPLGRVRVADFGAMRALWGAPRLREGLLKGGRAAYRAPEAHEDASQALTPAADIYSLGAVAFELLTLREPTGRPEPEDGAGERGRSSRLMAHLQRAMAPEPPGRFRRAGDFGAALRHHLAQQGGGPEPGELRGILAARLPVPAAEEGSGALPWREDFSLTPLEGVRLAPVRAVVAPPRPRRSYSRRPRLVPADERPTEEVTPELLEQALEALYAGVPAMSDERTSRPRPRLGASDASAARTPIETPAQDDAGPVTSWDAPAAAAPPAPVLRSGGGADGTGVRRTGRHARVKVVEDFQPREASAAPARSSGVQARVTGSRAAIVSRADFDEPLPPRRSGTRSAVGAEGARPSGGRNAPGRSTGSRRAVGGPPRSSGARQAVGGAEASGPRRSGVRPAVVAHDAPPEEERDSLAEYELELEDMKRKEQLEAEHRRYVAAQQKRLRDKIVRLVLAASVLLASIAGLAIYFHQKLQPEFIPPPAVPIGVSAEDAKFSAFATAADQEHVSAPAEKSVTGALLTVRSNHPANIYLDGRKLTRRAPVSGLEIPLDVEQIDIVSLRSKERRSFAADLKRGRTFTLEVTFDPPRR